MDDFPKIEKRDILKVTVQMGNLPILTFEEIMLSCFGSRIPYKDYINIGEFDKVMAEIKAALLNKISRLEEGNMPGKSCGKGGHRKHTPIVSKAQRGKFGAELKRRRTGKKAQMPGITTKELSSHLKESGGKKLPARTTGRKRGKTKRRK